MRVQESEDTQPYSVAPRLLNTDEVYAELEARYPPLLREAGVGGTVVIYFYLGADGRVERTLVNTSSGHRALDEAAIQMADVARFSPARDGEKGVPVWVSVPFDFLAR